MAFKEFKTEKMLLSSIVVLFLFLFASAFTKEMAGTNISSAEERSDSAGSDKGEESQKEESQDNKESDNDEDSQDDEESQDEESQEDEKSEPSVSSTPSVKTTKTTTRLNSSELSEKSAEETSQKSVETTEVSETSEPSEVSQEISEESIKFVEGYGEVISKEGNVALVKKNERLFFLVPVEVESRVTLDEGGDVVEEKKNFFNWLLAVFSF